MDGPARGYGISRRPVPVRPKPISASAMADRFSSITPAASSAPLIFPLCSLGPVSIGVSQSSDSAQSDFVAVEECRQTRAIGHQGVGWSQLQPVAATLKKRGADFAIIVVGPIEQAVRCGGMIMDGARPGLCDRMVSPRDHAGGAKLREAGSMNPDKLKIFDGFDDCEGSGF